MEECGQTPRIFISSQTGKEEKILFEDGSQRLFHHVAKNAVFSITISQRVNKTPKSSLINFFNLGVVCALVFDQKRQKPVEAMTVKPMEYKLIPSQNGRQLRIDARIKVLSSQYEGSLFCIYIQMVDENKNPIPDLCLFSHPIRVRSKVKPSVSYSSGRIQDLPSSSSSVPSPQKRILQHPSCVSTPASLMPPPLKRGRQMMQPNDAFDTSSPIKSDICEDDVSELSPSSPMSAALQALRRIEERQMQQQSFFEALAMNKAFPVAPQLSLDQASSSCGSPDEVPADYQPSHPSASSPFTVNPSPSEGSSGETQTSFCEQFLHLLTVFSQMSDIDKQQQLYIIQNHADENQRRSVVSLMSSLYQRDVPQVDSSFGDVNYGVVDAAGASEGSFSFC